MEKFVNMTKLLIVIAIFFNVHTFYAIDTIKVSKPISLDNFGVLEGKDYLLIKNRAFNIPFGKNLGFFEFLDYSKIKFSQVYFRHCFFNIYQPSLGVKTMGSNSGFFVLDSCEVNYLPIAGSSGKISISESILRYLTIKETNDLQIDLSYLDSISWVQIEDCRNLNIQHLNCSYKDSSALRIFNSSISQFVFDYSDGSGVSAYFINDTVNSFIISMHLNDANTSDFDRKKNSLPNEFTFKNCYINTSFIFFEPIPNSIFIFDNCTFGTESDLTDLALDKLVLKNCHYFPDNFSINFREKSKRVEIGFINVKLDKINIDFASNMKLVFDSDESDDVIANSYFNLLEKFRKEGKDRSFKNVDLQYRASKSGLINFLMKIWWHYGYNPALVFIWTAGFLLVFFALNFLCWGQILQVYNPFEDLKNEKESQSQKIKIKKVIVYTLFVFFAISADLKKIKFTNLIFILYILFQHVAGILCTLFIIKYVLNL